MFICTTHAVVITVWTNVAGRELMQTGKARLLHFSIVITDLFETIDIWNTPSKHLLNYHSRFFFKVWHTPLLPGFPKTLVFTLWNFPLTSSGFNEFFLEKPILNLFFFILECSIHKTTTEVVTMLVVFTITQDPSWTLNGPISIHVAKRTPIVNLFCSICAALLWEMELSPSE